MQPIDVEMSHGDRRRGAHNGDQRAERSPKPTGRAVPPHVTRAHQSRLQEKKQQPSRKNSGMNVENKRARNRRMNEVLADGSTEPEHHNRRNQQRHQKVKILLKKPAASFRSRSLDSGN